MFTGFAVVGETLRPEPDTPDRNELLQLKSRFQDSKDPAPSRTPGLFRRILLDLSVYLLFLLFMS